MSHRRATAALVLITLLWGLSFPAIKLMFRDISPLLAVGLRFGIAAAILSPRLPGMTRRELTGGLVIGGLFAVGVAFQNAGLEITTPSRSAFIVALSALLTPVVGAAVLGLAVSAGLLARLLVAMAGVYFLTAPAGGLTGVNRGDALTLVASLVYAGHILAVGHFARGSSVARILAIQFAVTALAGFGGAGTLETPRLVLTPRLGFLVAFLIANSLLTFALQIRAQRVVSANEAALIFTFEPVVAAGASYLAIGERLSAVQLVGGLVILLAVGWPRRAKETGPTDTIPGADTVAGLPAPP